MFKSEAKSEFGTTAIISGAMETAIRYWMDIYSGRPDWVDPEDNIKTIKFAKSICSETARLIRNYSRIFKMLMLIWLY